MKKILAFMLSFLVLFQFSLTAFAFKDTTANIFTGKKYTHNDRFKDHEIVNGLDISVHQGTINDFNKIKAAGVDFMFLRAAYRGYGKSGSLNKDTMFEGYIKGALSAGIDVGSYIYSQAITVKEAQDEADYILNIVKGYDITLPIVFDYEYISGGRLSNANLTNRQRTDICLAFCERVEKAGYTACVYANHSMFKNDLYTEEIASKYVLWLAQYSVNTELGGVLFQPDYSYWQYSSSGSVNGISGRVDCNFRYFKPPQKVENLKVKNETVTTATLTWGKVKDCYGYEIYKLDDLTKKYFKIATNKGAGICSFTDNSTNANVNTYKVKAISRNKGAFVGGEFSDEVKTKGYSKISLLSNGKDYATFTWIAVEDVAEYQVLRATSPTGQYETVAVLDSKTTNHTDYTKGDSDVYYYRVKAVINDAKGNFVKNVYTPYLEVKKTENEKPEDQEKEPVDHIHSYTQEIIKPSTCSQLGVMMSKCSCGDSFKESIEKAPHKVIVIKGLKATCLNSGITDGRYCSECGVILEEQKEIPVQGHIIKTETKKATYFESGHKSEYCTVCDEEFSFEEFKKLKLKVPSFSVSKGVKQFKVTYKKVDGASGFQVRYRIKGKWNIKTYNTKKQAIKTIKKLVKGTYKVQIRAFVAFDGETAYSKWTKAKKVTVKGK